MDLRDQVTSDLPTFLNVAEFADTVTIDGEEVACVLVKDETTQSAEGVTALESTLYVRQSDLFTPPEVRERVQINDDRQANVLRVDNEQGMWVVRLQWFNS